MFLRIAMFLGSKMRVLSKKETIFLIGNLPYALNIAEEKSWRFVRRKFERDFPWLLSQGCPVILSGVGRGWRGWSQEDHIRSHAGFCSVGWLPVDAVVAWTVHLIDALKASRGSVVLGYAPTPESGLGIALAKLLRRSRIRLIVRVQGHAASRALLVHHSMWRFKVLETIENFVLQQADLVLPMGKFTKQLAVANGVRPERILALPFPVQWMDSAEVTPLTSEPCVLFAGRLEKGKGIHVLLKGLSKVKETVPSVRLLIAGDGSFRKSLEALTEELGLCDRVSFLGWLEPEALQQAYRKTWVLVLPSIWEEGLGMVLVEAGLMGRPVIGSDLGGIRDVITHGMSGFLVQPGDPVSLADAIVAVSSDRHRCEQMGLANREAASQYLRDRDGAVERVRQSILGLAKQ